MALALQGAAGRPRACRGGASSWIALTLARIALRLLASGARGLAAFRSLQFHARPASFGETDGNGLFRIPRAVFAFADMVHLFAHKLARLCAGRLAFPGVFSCPFQGSLFRHGCAPSE